jgi:glutamyl-tRNA reductase
MSGGDVTTRDAASSWRLSVVGLSHHAVPVELRERVAVDAAGEASLARALGDVVCLSTCDRTELYLADGDEERAVALLEEYAGVPLAPDLYRLHDEAAAAHLFRVASGLDSLVPGEAEILGQVRDAFEGASPGPLLDRVFRQALRVGKRVRSETGIGRSPASVPSAAVALADQRLGGLEGRRVLFVGAGRMCALAAANLASRGATIAYVANRSAERGRALAERYGGIPLTLDEIPAHLGEVDLVLASTGAPRLLVHAIDVPAQRRAALCFVDIAVPRDIDPEIGELDGCEVYDIDDLEAIVSETLAGRRVEAELAERMIVEETERFREWRSSLDVVPAIVALRARAEEIRAAELAKLGHLSEYEWRIVEVATAQMLHKLLHVPTLRLKEVSRSGAGQAYADAVSYLFGLEGSSQPSFGGPWDASDAALDPVLAPGC